MIDEVIFLRHGRTGFNLQRRLQGQIDIPLDIVGQWQVDQSAYSLAQRFYWAKVSNIAAHPDLLPHSADPSVRRMDVDEYRKAPASGRTMRVVSSDLFRAQQTAHAFADILGLDVHLDARLRERSFGQWEGMTREEIRERFPEGSVRGPHTPAANLTTASKAAPTSGRAAPRRSPTTCAPMPRTPRPQPCSSSPTAHGSPPPSARCSTWTWTTSTHSTASATRSGPRWASAPTRQAHIGAHRIQPRPRHRRSRRLGKRTRGIAQPRHGGMEAGQRRQSVTRAPPVAPLRLSWVRFFAREPAPCRRP